MKTRITCLGMVLILVGGGLFWSPTTAAAADTAFKPFISISEELTDNIYETVSSRRKELTTRVRPGATLRYFSPFWTWDTAYTFEYRNYARNSKNEEFNHDASLKGNIALIKNFMFLDLSETYKRVTQDVSRNAATESSLFINQTDQNVASVSPYLVWRLKGDNTLKTGYRFTDTRYWDPISIDKQEHRGYADLTHAVTSRFSLTGGYAFNRLDSKPTRYNRHDLSGGFRYEYADKSFLYGQIGNSWQHFDTGLNVSYLFWNAGITHDFRTLVATIETRVSNTEDPLAVSTKETSYSAKLEKTLQRGMIGASANYSEFVNTATNHTDQRKLGFTATGRYEILQALTANLSATGERFSQTTLTEYPYRFSGSAGLSYAFKDELTLAVTYNHVSELYALDSNVDAKRVNKVVVEVKKVF